MASPPALRLPQSSLVGGIPAGGSISGTALLASAGARSRLANISAGLLVAVIVLLFAPLVEGVPIPAPAALLIVAGFQGLRVPEAVTVWNTGRVPAVIMIITFVATLIVPLQYAVLLGMVLSVVLHVFRVDETTHAVTAISLRGQSEIGSTFVTVLQRYAKALHAHDETRRC